MGSQRNELLADLRSTINKQCAKCPAKNCVRFSMIGSGASDRRPQIMACATLNLDGNG